MTKLEKQAITNIIDEYQKIIDHYKNTGEHRTQQNINSYCQGLFDVINDLKVLL